MTGVRCPHCGNELAVVMAGDTRDRAPVLTAKGRDAWAAQHGAMAAKMPDTVGDWLRYECADEAGSHTLLTLAYLSYQRHAARVGAPDVGLRNFVDLLELKGYTVRKRPGAQRTVSGLRLLGATVTQNDIDML